MIKVLLGLSRTLASLCVSLVFGASTGSQRIFVQATQEPVGGWVWQNKWDGL